MEGRATHSAVPAAVSPQLIPHKAERRFNTPIPAPFPRTSVNSSREGPEAAPDPGPAPGAAGPGPARPGRGARRCSWRAVLARQRHELCFEEVIGMRASASLCCAVLRIALVFGLGSGTGTASVAMYLLPSLGGCLHRYVK